MTERMHRQVTYLGFGGKTRIAETNMDLGLGRFRTPQYGFRRAFWDICHGYVSGFRKRDIAYYVMTRSFVKVNRSFTVHPTDEGETMTRAKRFWHFPCKSKQRGFTMYQILGGKRWSLSIYVLDNDPDLKVVK